MSHRISETTHRRQKASKIETKKDLKLRQVVAVLQLLPIHTVDIAFSREKNYDQDMAILQLIAIDLVPTGGIGNPWHPEK